MRIARTQIKIQKVIHSNSNSQAFIFHQTESGTTSEPIEYYS